MIRQLAMMLKLRQNLGDTLSRRHQQCIWVRKCATFHNFLIQNVRQNIRETATNEVALKYLSVKIGI